MTQAPGTTYSPTAKGLHWLIVLLLTVQFTTAFLLPHIGRNTPPSDIIDLHFSLGVLIMLAMVARLVVRLLHPVALDAKDAAPAERLLARLTHWLFYLILIVSPLMGWASASAHRLPVSLFGLIPLPPLGQHGRRPARHGDVGAAVADRPARGRRPLPPPAAARRDIDQDAAGAARLRAAERTLPMLRNQQPGELRGTDRPQSARS